MVVLAVGVRFPAEWFHIIPHGTARVSLVGRDSLRPDAKQAHHWPARL